MNVHRLACFLIGFPALAGPLRLDFGWVSSGGGIAGFSQFSVNGAIGEPVVETGQMVGGGSSARLGYFSRIVFWVNAAPTAAADTVERRAGDGAHVLVSELLGNDLDADYDTLRFVTVDSTTTRGGSVFRDGPWILYFPSPAADPTADDTFTYRVTDGITESVGTVTLRVAAPPSTSASPLEIGLIDGVPQLVELRFQGIAGRTYRVQRASALTGPWSDAGVVVASPTGGLRYSEPRVVEPRFFRLLEN